MGVLSVDVAHRADSMTPFFVLIELILVDLLPIQLHKWSDEMTK